MSSNDKHRNQEHPGIYVCGVSHHGLETALREQVTLSPAQLAAAQSSLAAVPQILEGVVLSTCNRTELIALVQPDGQEREKYIRAVFEDILQQVIGEIPQEIRRAITVRVERDGVLHLFRVAAGLDSQVIGEPQILGQVKAAYELAQQEGGLQSVLHRLFQRAFSAAKLVRTKTEIGRNAVSVCFAARKLAEQIFGALEEATLLVCGTGEMARLAIRHFHAAGTTRLYVTSRQWERACRFAETTGAVPLPREQLRAFLPEVEIVIGATSRAHDEEWVIDKPLVAESAVKRRGRIQFYVDLGVPRNFPTEIGTLGDLFLYTLDDLAKIVQENLDRRLVEFDAAENLLGEEVDRFLRWREERLFAPAIGEARRQMESFGEQELRKTLRRLRTIGFSEETLRDLELPLRNLVQGIFKKALHHPLAVLKSKGAAEPELVSSFLRFFVDRQAMAEKLPDREPSDSSSPADELTLESDSRFVRSSVRGGSS